MKRWLFAPLFVLACAATARADEIAGQWTVKDTAVKLVLRADGSYDYLGWSGTWKRDGSALTFQPRGPGEPPVTYKAELTGNTLVLSGGDLGDNAATFTRTGVPPAGAEDPKAKAAMDEFSRKPQGTPRDVTKLTPKFRAKTKVVKDPKGKFELTIPEGWTFASEVRDGVEVIGVNPGYGPTEIARQQIVFFVAPVKLSEIDQGFQDRVEKGASTIDPLYNANGITMKREKTQVLDAPGGLIARLDYAGTITNAFVQGQKAKAVFCLTQRKMYDVAVSILSVADVKKDEDRSDDAIAMLDAVKTFFKDRDTDLEKSIVGTWIVPSKTGNTWETYDFRANGTYKWHYESSYSGTFKESGGAQTGAWGTAGQNDESGRFEIRGDILFFVSDRGEQGQHFTTGVNEKGTPFLKIGKTTFLK